MPAATVSLTVPVAQMLAIHPAAAEKSIASHQAQLARIQATVTADNQKLDGQDEAYNEDKIRVQQDATQANAAKVRLASAQSQEASTKAQISLV